MSQASGPPKPSQALAASDGPAEANIGKAYDWRLLRRLWPFFARHPKLLLAAALLTPLSIALELAQPYLIKRALEDHIATGQPEGLAWLALGYAGLVVAQSLSSFVEQTNLQLLGQRAMHDLRCALYDHVLKQKLAYFDHMPVGRLMTRLTNDVESINEMFVQGVVTLAADVVKMVVIVGIMLWLSVKLTFVTFMTLPLLWLLVVWARGAMRRSFREIRLRLAAMNAFVQEHLSGIRVVQILMRQTAALREYDAINAAHRDAYLESIRADAAMYALVEALGVLAIALVAWISARALGASQASAAQTVATVALVGVFIEYINKFFIPVRDFSAKYAVMQGAMASAERIASVLDTAEFDQPVAAPLPVTAPGANRPDGAPASSPRPPTSAAPAIEFDDVSFGYGNELVLKAVTLQVQRGTTVAIVGATGSGKSTLIKLITRLYQATSGCIRLDGTDVTKLDLPSLRQRVTVVSQDVVMFAGTLFDNIVLGANVSQAQVEAAAQAVGLDAMLAARGATLDEIVAERGSNFSTGERQLIAFCRAMVRNPAVLILDEATAHVDPAIEAAIERGVSALMAGRTTLVIAHRLSTIRSAHNIIVLESGQLVEQGNHDALLAAQGVYAGLEQTFWRAGRNASPVQA